MGVDVREPIAQTVRLWSAARAADIPVFLVAFGHDEPDALDAGLWAEKINGMRDLRTGNYEAAIAVRLHDERVCARHGRGRRPIWLPTHGRARGSG